MTVLARTASTVPASRTMRFESGDAAAAAGAAAPGVGGPPPQLSVNATATPIRTDVPTLSLGVLTRCSTTPVPPVV